MLERWNSVRISPFDIMFDEDTTKANDWLNETESAELYEDFSAKVDDEIHKAVMGVVQTFGLAGLHPVDMAVKASIRLNVASYDSLVGLLNALEFGPKAIDLFVARSNKYAEMLRGSVECEDKPGQVKD